MEIVCGARVRDFDGRRYFYFWHYEGTTDDRGGERTTSAEWTPRGRGSKFWSPRLIPPLRGTSETTPSAGAGGLRVANVLMPRGA
jgi:hypothetical protein